MKQPDTVEILAFSDGTGRLAVFRSNQENGQLSACWKSLPKPKETTMGNRIPHHGSLTKHATSKDLSAKHEIYPAMTAK